MRNRSGLFLRLATLFLLSLAPGCGGNNGKNDTITVNTNGTGALKDVKIIPIPGSFIPSGNSFVTQWLDGKQPPAQFSVALHRYGEALGDASRSDTTQKIEVFDLGGNQWNIKRRDNFTLDTDGVYYLNLRIPNGELTRAAYIVSSTRLQQSGRINRDIPTPGHGSLNNVQVSPAPGSVFIPRDTAFVVQWPDGAEAPPLLGIDIWRYQEARGGQDRDVSDQSINLRVNQPAKRYTVTLKNHDGGQLVGGGVYFIELTGPGQVLDYAYIVSTD